MVGGREVRQVCTGYRYFAGYSFRSIGFLILEYENIGPIQKRNDNSM